MSQDERNYRWLIISVALFFLMLTATAATSIVLGERYDYEPFTRSLKEHHQFIEEVVAELQRGEKAPRPPAAQTLPPGSGAITHAAGLWHFAHDSVIVERRYLVENWSDSPVTGVEIPLWYVGDGHDKWVLEPEGYVAARGPSVDESGLAYDAFDEVKGVRPHGQRLRQEVHAGAVSSLTGDLVFEGEPLRARERMILVVRFGKPRSAEPVHAVMFNPDFYPHLAWAEMHVWVDRKVRYSLIPEPDATNPLRYDVFQPKTNIVVTKKDLGGGQVYCLSPGSDSKVALTPTAFIFKDDFRRDQALQAQLRQ